MKLLSLCTIAVLLMTGATALTACSRGSQEAAVSLAVAEAAASVPSHGLPLAVVHKSPSCGCCGLWVEHLKNAGFPVEVQDSEDVVPVKHRLGVPFGKGSCHTAEIAGYFIEGHVPAEDIKRLLVEKPDAKGLVLPGMPAGSPGMESPDGTSQPFTVELVRADGTTVPYRSH